MVTSARVTITRRPIAIISMVAINDATVLDIRTIDRTTTRVITTTTAALACTATFRPIRTRA